MIEDPKAQIAGLVTGAVATTAAWNGALAIFAQTTWPDVARDFVAVLSAFVIGYWAYKGKTIAGEAKAAASTAATAAVGAQTAAVSADTKATTAAQLAETAVKTAVVSEEKADRRAEVLADVARHTNGEFATMKAERDALQAWKEAALLASTPPTKG